MLIYDRVYGTFDIQNKILLDLLYSKTVQRLRDISQYPVPDEWYAKNSVGEFVGCSRYDHCVGALLLLKRLGASLEEQAAGLLHDVSHTTFSHIADWVFGYTGTENYQDKIHQNFLNGNDEVRRILGNYGLSPVEVSDLSKYGLLERPIPELCVDRIDYALRDFPIWFNSEDVQLCVNNLSTFNDKVVFVSRKSAEVFGRGYLRCQTEHWAGVETSLRAYLFSMALKAALRKGIIIEDDFLQTDSVITAKLKASDDKNVRHYIRLLSGDLKFVETEKNPEISIKRKFRYVDPSYVENGSSLSLSETDSLFKSELERARKRNEKGINVRLVV